MHILSKELKAAAVENDRRSGTLSEGENLTRVSGADSDGF